MAFVQRSAGGKIVGVFSSKQPGVPVEELADDHPELVARAAASSLSNILAEKRMVASASLAELALTKAMTDPLTPQAVKDYAQELVK